MNCHSNETPWPWYAYFAPGSWITSVHVTSARQQFNLSELNKMPSNRKTRLARDMADAIRNGVMPPIDFLFLHPEAQLTAAEKEQLIQGLQNSLK
jgi:Haem-binding domain